MHIESTNENVIATAVVNSERYLSDACRPAVACAVNGADVTTVIVQRIFVN